MRTPEESGFVEWKSIPKRNWSCEEWLQYYKALKKGTGKTNAQSNWVKAWKNIGVHSNASGCSNDVNFYGPMLKEGINTTTGDLDNLYAKFKQGASDVAGIYKTIWIVSLVVIGIIVVGLALAILRNPQQTISMGKLVASRGLIK